MTDGHIPSLNEFAHLAAASSDQAKILPILAQLGVEHYGFEACAVFLMDPEDPASLQQVACAGSGEALVPPSEMRDLSRACPICYQLTVGSCLYYHDLVGSEGTLGTVAVRCRERPPDLDRRLSAIAFYASVAGERSRLVRRLRSGAERLEVFRELNQLLATNADLNRTARALVRQSSLRFSADCSILLLLAPSGDSLEVIGNHGLTKNRTLPPLPLHNSLLGRTLRLGTALFIPDLRTQPDHGLEFLVDCGIKCIRCTHLDVRGKAIGMFLLGFRESTLRFDDVVFKEFCQSGAVAVATAQSHARLKSYAEQLEELVNLRTRDLEVQKEHAEEASRAKSRFVANMSHELRTPLTAIVGYASILADGVFGTVNEKQRDALQNISRSSAHLKELIDEVLNLSRIEAGKEDPEPSRVELQSLLQQIYKLMLQTAVGKGVQLQPVSVPAELREKRLWVDPRHIRQILINLVSNAVKYTPQGGKVEMVADGVGDKIRIGVRDTGVGIAPDKMAKLFERFERGDDSYSREQIGTGIGLALTKHLSAINGGRLWAESEIGVGSVFSVLMPLAEADGIDLSVDQTSQGAPASRLDGLNVLICDDNQLTCTVLETVIKHAGGHAYSAGTVADAKKVAESVDLDVAIIDLAIPGESGISLLDYFHERRGSSYGSIPTIVISACIFDNDRVTAVDHGASTFIPKPFHPADVLQTIRQVTTTAAMNASTAFNVDGEQSWE